MRGQMLLIVVLVMVVIMTVGLSAASRTITSIRVSTDEEASERAFSAAEAGLEVAISQNNNLVTGTLDNSTYNTTIRDLSGVEFMLNNSMAVLKDDSADVWLSRYPSYTPQYTGNLTIYWGSAADLCDRAENINTMAALDIVVISGNSSNPTIRHYPVDPCAARRGNNQFGSVSGGGTINGRTFAYATTLAINNGIMARIIPLYSSAIIGVRGCNAGGGGCLPLPAQGSIIESTGVSENAQRKIISFRAYPKLPTELFPFVIFVPN